MSNLGPHIPNNGLQLFYDFADPSCRINTSTGVDISGNNTSGYSLGSPTSAVSIALTGSFAYNGSYLTSGSCVTVGIDSSISSKFTTDATLFMWIKSKNPPADLQASTGLVTCCSSTTLYRTHYPWIDGLAYVDVFRAARVDGISLVGVDRTLPHLVTVTTKNGGLWKFYQNNIMQTSVAAETTVKISRLPMEIGRSTGGYYFYGHVYAFGLYNRELSSYEINAIYNNYKTRFQL